MERWIKKGYINVDMAKSMNIIREFDFNDYKKAIRSIEKGDVCKALIRPLPSINNSKL